MARSPVCGDNPRALASGLSYVQVDKHSITILYHLHQCIPCTPRDIFCVKVGKGGIKFCNHLSEEERADCFTLNGCMLSCGSECVSGFIPVNLVCACSLYKISQFKSKLPFSYFCLFGGNFQLP